MVTFLDEDEKFDYKGLNDAGDYISENLVRWGRVNVRDCKEKYRSLRIYLSLGWHQMHSILYPRYIYNQFPKWLWKLDCLYFSKAVNLLNYIVVPYHIFLYKLLYRRAVKKWPHLKREILCAADYPELLKALK